MDVADNMIDTSLRMQHYKSLKNSTAMGGDNVTDATLQLAMLQIA